MKKTICLSLLSAIVLLVSGCTSTSSNAQRDLQNLIDAYQNLVDSLEKVRDPASASQEANELDAKFAEVIRLQKLLPEQMQRYKEVKMDTATLKEMQKKMQQLGSRLKTEMERTSQLTGLPADFWRIVRPRSIELGISALEAAKLGNRPVPDTTIEFFRNIKGLLEKYKHEQVVTMELVNLPLSSKGAVIDKLRKAVPNATIFDGNNGGSTQIAIAPVDDFQKLVSAIDFGTIVKQDAPRRLIGVQVHFAGSGIPGVAVAPGGFGPPAPPGVPGSNRFGESQSGQPVSNSSFEDAEKHSKAMLEEMKKEREAMLKEERGPDPSDPDYYDKLVESMLADNSRHKSKAIEVFLNTKPEQIQSSETKKKIAKAFKQLAENGFFSEQVKAVQGLVIWGGKFSVPILITLFEDDHNPEIRKEILRAFLELNDPRCVPPIADKLGDFSIGHEVYKALEQMGSVAEDGIIKVVPSPKPEVCLAAINLLGEVGTDKCVSVLRKSLSSRNMEVREAGKAALKKVTARIKAEKESKK